jgi:xanthine dehydrogenase accessory factor
MPRGEIFDTISALRAASRPFCTATVIRSSGATSAKAGAKAAVTADGEVIGHLGGACVTGAVRKAAAAALADGQVRIIQVRPRETVVELRDAQGVEVYGSSCPSGGSVDLLIEPYRLPPLVAVLGASPVAAAIARQAALAGYRVAVAAPPEDLERMPAADFRLPGLDLAAARLEPDDFVVVASQGKRDLEALRAALSTAAAYVAMVASRRKGRALLARLGKEGVPAERLEQVRAPAGLDLGGIEPEEIAVSIVAEVILLRNRRRASATSGQTAAAAAPGPRADR